MRTRASKNKISISRPLRKVPSAQLLLDPSQAQMEISKSKEKSYPNHNPLLQFDSER